MNVLVLNSGSSSLKFRLLQMEGDPGLPTAVKLASGQIERVGTPQATLKWAVGSQPPSESSVPSETHRAAAEQVLRALTAPYGPDQQRFSIDAIGHRIVHGGARFTEPTRIDPGVKDQLRALEELAPLHNPPGLAGIDACLELLPSVPSAAVFDTAFHHEMPPVAATYALPRELIRKWEVRRYGFHGSSYRYVSGELLRSLGRGPEGTRLILCHLGNGASVCALRDGRSVDTSMGFTPLEGLVMGSRSGDIDAGLVLYLMHQEGCTPEEMERLLNKESGLKGLTGRSDVRDLEQAEKQGDADAALALDLFAYRVRKYIGAYLAALGGLDALAFTGGIGEHSATMRARILKGLEFLRLRLDPQTNQSADGGKTVPIHSPDDSLPIWIVPTDEELQIARETYALLK